MLLPVRVVHPDAVGLLEILLLERVEELVDHMLFRPEAVQPQQDAITRTATMDNHDDDFCFLRARAAS